MVGCQKQDGGEVVNELEGQILKEDDTPEPRREEIPNFRDKVMNTSRWQTSRRKEILDAVTTDEALEKYREDPDVKELIEKKNQSFIQDIEFIRRLHYRRHYHQ